MAMKINPPEFKNKAYDRYKQELNAWKEITELPKKKQGIAVALTLPEEHDSGIREKVFDEMTLDDLKDDDGLKKLITFMDSKLGKDDLTDSLEKFEDFENFVRGTDQNIVEFIAKFDQKYNKLKKKDMSLPPAILAFKLLRKANITKNERLLVLTGMDYAMKDELYDQAKKSLLKFKGEQGTGCDSGVVDTAIKLEPAFLAQHEEALVAAGYVRSQRNHFYPQTTLAWRWWSWIYFQGFIKVRSRTPDKSKWARWQAYFVYILWIIPSSNGGMP
jgi:hypothetical protein